MSYEPYTGDEADEQEKVTWSMMLFGQTRPRRVNFEQQWEESASLCWPEWRNSWWYGRDISPGQKLTQFQYDSRMSVAAHRFGAICDSLMTPQNLVWSGFEPAGPQRAYLMKNKAVRQYFDDLSALAWYERYRPEANFVGQNQQNWQALGVFGNMGLWVDELDFTHDPKNRGLRFRSMPIGECYILQDHQGHVVGIIRHFRRTAQQAKNIFRNAEKEGRWPAILQAALQIGSQQLYNFLHFVRPRSDYCPWEIFSPRGRKWTSYYISADSFSCIEEGQGYRSFPMAFGRYTQAPDEEYGRGPAQMVLAAGKTLNAEKGIFLKQGHRAADPAYLVPDTGLIDLKLQGGAINAGGMTADGKPLVGVLPVGQIQLNLEMMQEENAIIGDAFLVNLFQLLLADKDFQMGPRQVVEYANERGILLGPTVGRQFNEYIAPICAREIDILAYQKKLPRMPGILREAQGEYQVCFKSPLARAMRSQEAAGVMRTAEFASELVQMTGSQEITDILDTDEMLKIVGDANNAPTRIFASPQNLQQKRKARSDAMEREQQVKELPGKAAIMKAQAIAQKAQTGGNIGGTLSGTPEGGMPMMPGQAAPGGRAFGQPGGQ